MMETRMIKLIVAGSRNIVSKDVVFPIISDYLRILKSQSPVDFEIVTGMAKGVDMLAKEYAQEHYIPVKEFPANWDGEGKSAGYKRNIRMAQYADHLLAIWDGESKGTSHMIKTAVEYGLKTHIVKKENSHPWRAS